MRAAAYAALAALALAALALAAPARAEPMRFAIDPDASQITVAVSEPMAALRGAAVGSFHVSAGEISGDSANPAATGNVAIAIDAASYTSDSSWRDGVVRRSALEADSYPKIAFQSTGLSEVAMSAPNAGSATVAGLLTLHGVARALMVSVRAALDGDRLIADGEVAFKYTDFGVQAPALLGTLSAGDEAKVTFHIVGIRAAPLSAPARPSPAPASPLP